MQMFLAERGRVVQPLTEDPLMYSDPLYPGEMLWKVVAVSETQTLLESAEA